MALPAALLSEVLSFLDGRSLARAECVSRALRDAARDSSAPWLSVLRGEAGVSLIEAVRALGQTDLGERLCNGHTGSGLRVWDTAGHAARGGSARSAYMSRMRSRRTQYVTIAAYAAVRATHARLHPVRIATQTVLRWTHLTLGVSCPPVLFVVGLIFLPLRLDGDPNFTDWTWTAQLAALAYSPGLFLADGALTMLVACVRYVSRACPRCDVFLYARCDGPWRVLLYGARGGGEGGGGRWPLLAARGAFLGAYFSLLTVLPLLIGAKLDRALHAWSWAAVISPLWVALPMTCCLPHVAGAVGTGPNRIRAQLALLVACAFVLLLAACVTAKLDGVAIPWTVALLPVWVFALVLIVLQLALAAVFASRQHGRVCRRAASALALAFVFASGDAVLVGTPLLMLLKLEGLNAGSWVFACLPMLAAASVAGIGCVAAASGSFEWPGDSIAAEAAPPPAPTAAAAVALPWRLANRVAV